MAGTMVSAVLTLGASALMGNGVAWGQTLPSGNGATGPTGVIAGDNSVTWYVSPASGNDRTGDGSPNKPLATLTYALRVAQAKGGGIIQLGAGTYDLNSGEQFPLIVGSRTIVRGNEATKGQEVQIVGGGEYNPSSFSSNNLTLLVPKGAAGVEIRGVTVINPSSRGYGVWVDGSSPVIFASTFTGNQIAGMILTGESMAILANNIFLRNGNAGLIIDGAAKPTIRSNVFQQTGFGLDVRQFAQPQVNENLFYSNQDGMIIQANARPSLRGNLIEHNQRNGIILNASAGLDFGDVNDAAGNVLRNNGELDIVNASRLPVVSNGNQFNPRRSRGQVRLLDKNNLLAVAPNKSNSGNNGTAARLGNGLNTSLSVQPLTTNTTTNTSSFSTNASTNSDFNATANNATGVNLGSPRMAQIASPAPASPKPEGRPSVFPSVIDQQTLNNANTAFGRNAQANGTLNNWTNNVPNSRTSDFGGLTVINANPLGNPLIVQVNTGFNLGSGEMGVVALSSPNITPDLQPVVTRPPAGQPVNQPIVTAPPVYVTNNRNNPSFVAPKYRVIVRDSRPNTISLVKRLIPNAFASQLNGQMVIQVGAYADRRVADAQVQRLAKEGLVAQVQNIR